MASFLIGSFGGASAQAGVNVDWAVSKTTLLSGETAVATVTISNNSSQAVRLETGKTTFETYAAGRWQTSPSCNRTCWRSFTDIAPGSQAAVPVTLPSCTVYSDPCRVTVIVHYAISQGGTLHDDTVRLPTYQFVPDPTATFDVDGLSGNRAAFIAAGSATGTATPDLLLVWAIVSPFTNSARTRCNAAMLEDVIGKLQRAGVSASELECGGSSGSDVVRVLVSGWRGKEEAVDAALQSEMAKLRATKGPPFAPPSISKSLGIDLRPFDTLWAAADDDAAKRAQRMATIVRAGAVGRPAKSGTPTYAFNGRPSEPGVAGLHDTPFHFAELPGTTPSPVEVTVSWQSLFVGDGKAFVRDNSALRRRAAESARWFSGGELPPMQPLAAIAADRPELYVVGNVSTSAALELGLDPEFAAIEDARMKATALAELIGVHLGPESLFAAYSDPADPEQTVGVATTFSQRRIGSLPRTTADTDVKLMHWNDLSHAVGLPIGVPDPSATIAEVSRAEVSRKRGVGCASALRRLQAAAIRQDETEAAADALRSHRRLRKLLLAATVAAGNGSSSCAPSESTDRPLSVTASLVYRTF